MHYQHRYHAGNFADVFKHALLCELLAALNRKETPWFYLETHAGAGVYDLARDEAARTAEFEDGIARLWDLRGTESPISDYLRLIAEQNPDGALRYYPGSPAVVQKLARASDRLALCEKVPDIVFALKHALDHDARIAVHTRDGYEAYALLPPQQKRGLVLIDPPFERRDEFDGVSEFLERALGRFSNGIYAAWYPMKNKHDPAKFIRRCERELKKPMLRVELDTDAHAEGQMHACGMLVVNPPFGFDERAREILKFLARKLAQGRRPLWSVA